jgi:PAS domain S-box-containing protein
MKTKQIMVACGVFLFAAFSLFVMFYQSHVRARAMVQIQDHADIIASSLWTFEKSSPTAYLTLAAKANGYERIAVRNDQGAIFLDIRGQKPTIPDAFLRSARLLPVYPLEAVVEFEGKKIGKISALWPCRAIYVYLYILFCIFLILPGIWFFLKLLDSNRTLESRVQERTADLEKENSERKRTEEALRQATLVVESSPVMLFRWKAEEGWPVALVSQNVIQIGYTPEELLNGSIVFNSIVHPDDLERVGHEVQTYSDGGVDRFQQEYRIITKDGQVRWVDDRTVVERDAEGRIGHYRGIIVDITERKRADEVLRKYERIVSTSQDLMALVSRDYIYEAVNESFLTAHRKTREEVVGRTMPEVIGEGVFREKIQRWLDQALSGQTVRYQEQLDFTGLGSRIVDATYFPVVDEKGKVEGVVVNARDITDTRKLEEQLIQSQRIESIGTLAGGVAHEINNPINGIMNYAQLILDRLEKGNPAAGFAGEILHETQRIAEIVRNLLTFARNEKQTRSPAQISDIVSSVLSLIQTVMRHDQIVLEVAIPEGLPKIKCRSQQIQQVVMNLLTNARDSLNERYPGYSPEKRLRIVAELISKQGRRVIRTTVEDNGIGIPAEIRDRIFDPFFTTKPKETGTGLGLSISYGIVRDHGGELIVESEPDRYTRVHMDLDVDNGSTLSEKRGDANGKSSH